SRTFSSLPALRPSTSQPASAFGSRRPTVLSSLLQGAFTPAAPTATTTTTIAADVVPTSAITTHPALLQTQIRCGPRRYMNMNRPSRLIRQRRHGFLSRVRTKNGRKMLQRRLSKRRKMLSA
ncbi:hypothetical protein M406DRAFT_243886, partial [Cryphonectria parasitica EP155]